MIAPQTDKAAECRVLFVSYLFPPVGGVGVHRVTKFVKYLPQFGWNCSVLTVANPSTPLVDGSLKRDIPASTIVCRARTLEPSYAVKSAVASGDRSAGWLTRARGAAKAVARRAGTMLLQPDPQILWRPDALKVGLKLLRETPHQAIIATGPPFSSLLVGVTLAKKTGLPLILDYRDEWGISNAYWENKQHNHVSNWIQNRMQDRAIRAASTLLATTPSSTRSLADHAARLGHKVCSRCILNGFDPDDFGHVEGRSDRTDFGHGTSLCRIAFIGTLWNLNPIEPFVDGVLRFAGQRPDLAAKLELVFTGRRTGDQDAALERLNETPCKVVKRSFVAHEEAVRMMRDADALLLLNADKPGTQRIINAKTFEYMAARRPLLVVAPEGDLWDVVKSLPGVQLCPPSQADRIADALVETVMRHERGVRFDAAKWDISRFERRHLAGELSDLLDETVSRVRVTKYSELVDTERMYGDRLQAWNAEPVEATS